MSAYCQINNHIQICCNQEESVKLNYQFSMIPNKLNMYIKQQQKFEMDRACNWIRISNSRIIISQILHFKELHSSRFKHCISLRMTEKPMREINIRKISKYKTRGRLVIYIDSLTSARFILQLISCLCDILTALKTSRMIYSFCVAINKHW